MWNDVGISRSKESLLQARTRLDQLAAELNDIGVGNDSREFNLTWQDWLNLRNLILVSRTINEAAIARENSRGSHYREDFPEAGDLAGSYYTVVNLRQGQLNIENRQVMFTRVQPGETILLEA